MMRRQAIEDWFWPFQIGRLERATGSKTLLKHKLTYSQVRLIKRKESSKRVDSITGFSNNKYIKKTFQDTNQVNLFSLKIFSNCGWVFLSLLFASEVSSSVLVLAGLWRGDERATTTSNCLSVPDPRVKVWEWRCRIRRVGTASACFPHLRGLEWKEKTFAPFHQKPQGF